ncbi:MAG: Required for respiratory growth protein 9 mitochondrial [Vezdaea acicularis]|nr:MAG: Required for respiratory growth protein 9 mitochondrial [Vezdaea acicularis]
MSCPICSHRVLRVFTKGFLDLTYRAFPPPTLRRGRTVPSRRRFGTGVVWRRPGAADAAVETACEEEDGLIEEGKAAGGLYKRGYDGTAGQAGASGRGRRGIDLDYPQHGGKYVLDEEAGMAGKGGTDHASNRKSTMDSRSVCGQDGVAEGSSTTPSSALSQLKPGRRTVRNVILPGLDSGLLQDNAMVSQDRALPFAEEKKTQKKNGRRVSEKPLHATKSSLVVRSRPPNPPSMHPKASRAPAPLPKRTPLPPRKREPWQIQKSALLSKFGSQGWSPLKKLSPDALTGLRALHAQDPEVYSTPVLAAHFAISPEAVRRVLRGKWRPASPEGEEERLKRWDRRGRRIWERMVNLGVRPPKRWREMGGGREKEVREKRRGRGGGDVPFVGLEEGEAGEVQGEGVVEGEVRPRVMQERRVPLSERIL